MLLTELSTQPLGGARAARALARVNFLHGLHADIRPGDVLYTLLLFATQPAEFVARYEWRALTEMERAAAAVYWAAVGVRMGVPAAAIPATLEDMQAWARAYEAAHMRPHALNHAIGVRTRALLLYWVPTRAARWLGEQAVSALCDERLRRAMMFAPAAAGVPPLVEAVLAVRRWALLWLALPRRARVMRLGERDKDTGKYHVNYFDNEPWYVKPTLWNRWGPWAMLARVMGKPVPGDSGFGAGGYEIESVGPVKFERLGHETVRREAELLQKFVDKEGGAGTCPFA